MQQDTADSANGPQALLSHVQRAVEGTRALQDDNARLRDELDRVNATLALQVSHNEQLSQHLAKSEALRDHYMKRSVELEVSLSTAHGVLAECIAKGRGGVYTGTKDLQQPALRTDGAAELARKLAPQQGLPPMKELR